MFQTLEVFGDALLINNTFKFNNVVFWLIWEDDIIKVWNFSNNSENIDFEGIVF